MDSAGTEPQIIFLLGIRRRSGTNYLGNLLSRHPDCAKAEGLWEDQLVQELDSLERYVQRSSSRWQESRRDELRAEARLGLGEGIRSALTRVAGPAPFIWTKTPSVEGLGRARAYFPDAAFLLLVRDGRAVVESARRTFGREATLEAEARGWAEGARAIDRFLASDPGPHVLVRYEDLVQNTPSEMRSIFEALGPDPDRYDYACVDDVPVKGSSTYHGEGAKGPHWQPVPISADFRPLARAESWTVGQHRRFDSFAGEELERFGYEQAVFRTTSPSQILDAVLIGLERAVRWSWKIEMRLRRMRSKLR